MQSRIYNQECEEYQRNHPAPQVQLTQVPNYEEQPSPHSDSKNEKILSQSLSVLNYEEQSSTTVVNDTTTEHLNEDEVEEPEDTWPAEWLVEFQKQPEQKYQTADKVYDDCCFTVPHGDHK